MFRSALRKAIENEIAILKIKNVIDNSLHIQFQMIFHCSKKNFSLYCVYVCHISKKKYQNSNGLGVHHVNEVDDI